jgi:phosphate transport system substrate-binding protein
VSIGLIAALALLAVGCYLPFRLARRICQSLAAALVLLMAALAGGLLLTAFLLSPGYWLAGGAWLCFLAAALLWIWRPWPRRRLAKAAAILAAAPVLAFLALAAPKWHESRQAGLEEIERQLSLREYEPFRAGSLVARLDGPASLALASDPPALDGATALYPLYSAFAAAVYPPGEHPVDGRLPGEALGQGPASLVVCESTAQAFANLLDGLADVAFLLGPSEGQLREAEEAGLRLRLTPIGREAFVFFVNRQNPVESLTAEEIRGVYSGRIADWRELGGPPGAIRAYQRREGSGSQSALARAMAGTLLAAPRREEVFSLMSGIHEAVAGYRNYRSALGFSFRYYLTGLRSAERIRLLAIGGVPPTLAAVQDGSYPFVEEIYAATLDRGQSPLRPRELNALRLVEWILSPEGQALVERTGYAPIR